MHFKSEFFERLQQQRRPLTGERWAQQGSSALAVQPPQPVRGAGFWQWELGFGRALSEGFYAQPEARCVHTTSLYIPTHMYVGRLVGKYCN